MIYHIFILNEIDFLFFLVNKIFIFQFHLFYSQTKLFSIIYLQGKNKILERKKYSHRSFFETNKIDINGRIGKTLRHGYDKCRNKISQTLSTVFSSILYHNFWFHLGSENKFQVIQINRVLDELIECNFFLNLK